MNLIWLTIFAFPHQIVLATDVAQMSWYEILKAKLPEGDIFWVFMIIGMLNAMSSSLDWVAKVIPGETDDKIIFWIKKVLAGFQRVIDFFTARGRR